MSRLFWLNDEAWAAIEPHLPRNRPGARRVDDRRVISGILHVIRTGCPWRQWPPEYGPHTTIYNRFNRWSGKGYWKRIMEALVAGNWSAESVAMDASYVKAIARRMAERMAHPVRKRFLLGDLNSLRQRIGPVGCALAKMEIRASRAS